MAHSTSHILYLAKPELSPSFCGLNLYTKSWVKAQGRVSKEDLLPGPNGLTLQTCAATPLQNESFGSSTSVRNFGPQLPAPSFPPLLEAEHHHPHGANASACGTALWNRLFCSPAYCPPRPWAVWGHSREGGSLEHRGREEEASARGWSQFRYLIRKLCVSTVYRADLFSSPSG